MVIFNVGFKDYMVLFGKRYCSEKKQVDTVFNFEGQLGIFGSVKVSHKILIRRTAFNNEISYIKRKNPFEF